MGVSESHAEAIGVHVSSWTTVNPLEFRGWDDVVLTHPDCNFFHSRAWASIIMSTYRFSPCYIVSCDSGDVNVFPVMDVRGRFVGRRGVSLPFTDDVAPSWAGVCPLLYDR